MHFFFFFRLPEDLSWKRWKNHPVAYCVPVGVHIALSAHNPFRHGHPHFTAGEQLNLLEILQLASEGTQF